MLQVGRFYWLEGGWVRLRELHVTGFATLDGGRLVRASLLERCPSMGGA
jgi:hypothetical protein